MNFFPAIPGSNPAFLAIPGSFINSLIQKYTPSPVDSVLPEIPP